MKQSYRTRIAGLLRCCLQTLDEEMNLATEPPKEGDTLHCKYCDDVPGMVFRGGAWQRGDLTSVKKTAVKK